jgi:hypothetical protein
VRSASDRTLNPAQNQGGDEEMDNDVHCSIALSSSLKLTSREAAAMSSCGGD